MADGKAMNVLGKVQMNMVFGKCEMYHEVVVADIKSENGCIYFNLFTKRSWLQTRSKSTILGSKMSGFRWYKLAVCKIN